MLRLSPLYYGVRPNRSEQYAFGFSWFSTLGVIIKVSYQLEPGRTTMDALKPEMIEADDWKEADNTLSRWYYTLEQIQHGYYDSARVVERRDRRLKISIAIVTAAVGCLVFAALNQFWMYAIGFINIGLAIAIAAQNALGYQEIAAKYRAGGIEFGFLLREIDVIRSTPIKWRGEPKKVLDPIKNRWDGVVSAMPLIEPSVWKKMQDRIARPKELADAEMREKGLLK
jgi:hypothetical protein